VGAGRAGRGRAARAAGRAARAVAGRAAQGVAPEMVQAERLLEQVALQVAQQPPRWHAHRASARSARAAEAYPPPLPPAHVLQPEPRTPHRRLHPPPLPQTRPCCVSWASGCAPPEPTQLHLPARRCELWRWRVRRRAEACYQGKRCRPRPLAVGRGRDGPARGATAWRGVILCRGAAVRAAVRIPAGGETPSG
jgi:hypothetical protein